MSRVKLPEFPISKLERTRLKKKYVKILGATEGVDDSMISESSANYLIPEIDYRGMVCLDLGANIGAFTQMAPDSAAASYIHLRAHETKAKIVCRGVLERKTELYRWILLADVYFSFNRDYS